MKEEKVKESDKRYFSTVFMTMFLFYAGLASFSGLWYLITNGHWWLTCVGVALFGLSMVCISWSDLRTGTYYTRDFLYPIDEKRVFNNGVFVRLGEQAYMLANKHGFWLNKDTTKLEKLPVRVYYNAFRKAIDRKVNIGISQVQQVR